VLRACADDLEQAFLTTAYYTCPPAKPTSRRRSRCLPARCPATCAAALREREREDDPDPGVLRLQVSVGRPFHYLLDGLGPRIYAGGDPELVRHFGDLVRRVSAWERAVTNTRITTSKCSGVTLRPPPKRSPTSSPTSTRSSARSSPPTSAAQKPTPASADRCGVWRSPRPNKPSEGPTVIGRLSVSPGGRFAFPDPVVPVLHEGGRRLMQSRAANLDRLWTKYMPTSPFGVSLLQQARP
jgi:hypothetical protein